MDAYRVDPRGRRALCMIVKPRHAPAHTKERYSCARARQTADIDRNFARWTKCLSCSHGQLLLGCRSLVQWLHLTLLSCARVVSLKSIVLFPRVCTCQLHASYHVWKNSCGSCIVRHTNENRRVVAIVGDAVLQPPKLDTLTQAFNDLVKRGIYSSPSWPSNGTFLSLRHR